METVKKYWVHVSVFLIISLVLASVMFDACSQVNKYLNLEDDHIIEEMIEDHIEDQTGLDIDITPNTPE